MSERDAYPAGVPCWVDTLQPDVTAALKFYGELFGWEFEGPGPLPGGLPGQYFVARLRGRDVGGIGTLPGGGDGQAIASWNTYVRVQSVDETAAVMIGARRGGVRSINLDLIYGLPRQTPESFAATLEQVIALSPDRIAAYGYAHLPERFAAQRQIDKYELPDAGTRLTLLQQTVEMLTAAGYVHIGVDHFALPDDDLARALANGTLHRNFQGYSTHAACDLVGFGMSAIGHVGDTFSQNAKDLVGYYAALDGGRLPVARGLRLDDDDVVRADVIQQLMCSGDVDVAAFEDRHSLDFALYFRDSLRQLRTLEQDGLVESTPARIRVTARGRFLLRNIARCFDAYAESSDVRYSRAV